MSEEAALYKRKAERLASARIEAENLLEQKSRELFLASEQLKRANSDLESRVAERTQELEAANKALLDAAKRDPATGLFNSSYFTNILDKHCRQLSRDKNHFALIYFDIDGFKAINDSYGHYIGDEAILELAELIKSFIPSKAFPSRHGGDEFIILLPNCTEEEAIEFASTALNTMRTSPLTAGSLIVTASIGIAVAPFAGKSSRELYIAADAAMYEAKRNGRNQYQCFSEKLQLEIKDRGELANSLKTAIAEELITVSFQPQYTVDGTLVGAEALARWEDSRLGNVSPVDFIKIAEETGQITPLGQLVLDKTIGKVADWIDGQLLGEGVKVAVNVSILQLVSEGFIKRLKAHLDARPDLGRYIEIELTESILVRDFGLATQVIDKLRGWGLSVALDDFGTVHSGFNYLCKLPVDKIKVDRMFTSGVLASKKTKAVVKSMITLAKELEIDVVVEGVETEAELEMIASLGTAIYQGFFFSKPLNADNFERLLVNSDKR